MEESQLPGRGLRQLREEKKTGQTRERDWGKRKKDWKSKDKVEMDSYVPLM